MPLFQQTCPSIEISIQTIKSGALFTIVDYYKVVAK